MTLKALAKSLMPPVVADLAARRHAPAWAGDYGSWAEAMAASSGYDAPSILERVEASALRVKRGEAVYERDGVVFDAIQYSWPLLAGLMWVAAREGGRLDVVDFGGALGTTYFQNRRFLEGLREVRWSIVEQPHWVERGRRSFQDERLRFHESLEQALAAGSPNLIVVSSVLQYLEQPHDLLAAFDRFPFAIIDLTPVHPGAQDRLTVQEVPPTIYPARYPCWMLSEPKLRAALATRGRVVTDFDAAFGQDLRVPGLEARYRGYVVERS
ncbi:MAG TPA: methyltransferase, TIGR04325 family [Candidatus Eisenbacteria bacterium]|nr:methyltransferase, TIGR04325 family [Candidatus Eisenbacteria bacterium]